MLDIIMGLIQHNVEELSTCVAEGVTTVEDDTRVNDMNGLYKMLQQTKRGEKGFEISSSRGRDTDWENQRLGSIKPAGVQGKTTSV